MTNGWFSSLGKMVLLFFWCKEAVCSWFTTKMGGFQSGFLFSLMKKAVFALVTCSLALGGAAVGTITGAIKGQTTETGFLRGAAIGAVAGAITAVQLMELTVHGDPLSKVALLLSLMNVKIFMEWMASVVQKAHQWEISNLEENFGGYPEIFAIDIGTKGLSQDSIKKLQEYKFSCSNTTLVISPCQEIKCIICLEDFDMGDSTRILPSCGHSFHLNCIDEWLTRHGSCPLCRKDV